MNTSLPLTNRLWHCYSNYILYALAKVLKKVCAPPKVCFKKLITPLIICMKKVFAPSIFAPAHPSDKYCTVPKSWKKQQQHVVKIFYMWMFCTTLKERNTKRLLNGCYTDRIYLYTFSLYENASLIIVSAETEYISTRSWYRNINFLRDRWLHCWNTN